jgi:hypothetical protein
VPENGLFGPSFFRLDDLPDPPSFMASMTEDDYRNLKSWQVVELLKRLDLTRDDPPSAKEMNPKSWTPRPDQELRTTKRSEWRWAKNRPAATVGDGTLPKAISSMWTSGPYVPKDFMDRLERRVRVARSEGWQVVLLTDVPRSEFEAAADGRRPPGMSQGYFDAVRDLRNGARSSGIKLVNIWELRNRKNPMRMHKAVVAELNKQTGRGYAGVKDIVSVENAERFGLPYADPDDFVETFQHVQGFLDSEKGYAIQRVEDVPNNSVLIAAKENPISAAWLDVIAKNYGLSRDELVPGLSRETDDDLLEISSSARAHRRYSTLWRAGPETLTELRDALGYESARSFPRAEGIAPGSAGSWLKPHRPQDRIPSSDQARTLDFAKRFFAAMVRGVYNGNGDLHLVEFAKAAEKHEDPDLIWNATLPLFASIPELRQRVTSVTTSRYERTGDSRDDPLGLGKWHDVELPEKARKLFQHTDKSFTTENGDERQPTEMVAPDTHLVSSREEVTNDTRGGSGLRVMDRMYRW